MTTNGLITRWQDAHARNTLFAWHAISTWMAAEALMASIDGDIDRCTDFWTLSDLAHQHQLDLQPAKMELA